MHRAAALASVLSAALTVTVPAGASAAVGSVLSGATVSGKPIPCLAQLDRVRVCHGTDGGPGGIDLRFKTFDGTPLEVYVMLPPEPPSGGDGDYPLVVQSHGWGNSAGGPDDTQFYGPTADQWAKGGYAVVQLTARGFGDSCGTPQSRLMDPAGCMNGYIRLDDDRYEVRDIQTAVGDLVDEGIADAARVGATGESYGGGVSLQLASLKNRIYDYSTDRLIPWKSPNGMRISLAAAAPMIPWSDLVSSLLPNGRTLDYEITSPTADLAPFGVEKQSFVTGLYATGDTTGHGYYAPPGGDAQADLSTWFGVINAGEPYESNPMASTIANQIAKYHSAYYLLDGAYGTPKESPPPLLIANGFTDDLFPVDEAVRYYNLDQALYPSAPIALWDMDFGHMRGQNKAADTALLPSAIKRFFDEYVKGTGAQAPSGVTALTQTCPSTAPSGGPIAADTWADLHPGEVQYRSAGTAQASQKISSTAGDPAVARAVDPIAGGGACATVPATDQGSGVATYRAAPVAGAGYMLLGSPTMIAKLTETGSFGFIAARLWDVNPATRTQTLVARGVYRLDPSASDGLQVFQLHPGAWHFAAGHIPKLELLGQDSPYARSSNGQFQIAVSDLQLRLPVHEAPGARGAPAAVTQPEAPVVTKSGRLAPCRTAPYSTIDKRHVRASRAGLSLRGTAGEHVCVRDPAPNRRLERPVRVYVLVYRPLGHGLCAFLERNGRLSHRRSCRHVIEFRARGTRRWILRLRRRVPRGRYLVRVDALDGRGVHQRYSAASLTTIRIR